MDFKTYWRIFIYVVFLLCSAYFNTFAQSSNRNYVITRTYKKETTNSGGSGRIQDATQQVQYIDGLGRPLQSVLVHQSPQINEGTPYDLISHTEYDSFGRPLKNYLPYPSLGNGAYQSGASSTANNYYNSSAFCNNNERGYSQTEYELSPLNRVKKQYAGGSNKAVEFYYGVNDGNEVKQYDVNNGNLIGHDSYYIGGTLTYKEVKDENGNRSREYTNKAGQTILKRAYNGSEQLDTYYVYNDLGQLCFVLQPKYQDEANQTKYAFKYTYNDRGLVSTKYVPGAGTISMNYNGKDLLVESVDGRGKTSYIKYDDLNRIIETGDKSSGSEQALVRTHYDNYSPPFDANPAGRTTLDFSSLGNGFASSYQSSVKGQVTITTSRIINTDGSYGDWLYAKTYYNERYIPLQTISEKYDLGSSSRERVTSQVRFDGRVEKQQTTQATGTGIQQIEKYFTYDHADRLLSTRLVIKKEGTTKKDVFLSAQRYDGIGQAKAKYLHSVDGGSSFKERLDYCFTPRSWLKKVTGQNSTGVNFGFELKYNDPANGNAQYNGNIAEMLWRQGNGNWVGYKFTYDGVNRLLSSEGINNYNYRESIVAVGQDPPYDKNGNIRGLQRIGNGGNWDNLSYSYNGNRLMRVEDSWSTDGFVNGNNSTDDYAYDGNGNATKDLNKGVNNIEYNILNLVRQVSVNNKSLQYVYDGSGTKLRLNNGTSNTKYAGAFEYNESNYLTRIATEEGQINVSGNGNTYEVQYYLKDHLGNVRMVMNEGGTIIQETEYFAFGLSIAKTVGPNKYLYNEKEKTARN
ncbi:DUF6443 domain-containing protein [Siphonobacter sp. SORGH_AS_1065]|uniref:DUF6443 domain-containing protein n=1 Tax=Siphonobacter sp. SORGH_AS_1065 TaxID=3041795 RepID=UPI002783A5F6|nr:DUF6443 domain-containing protein [Siphonobacter sp. SORGH_AS_1065]MDQ1086543.1 hypothetical protein [Siphonobacter sp. SORGH_AS_1065]